MIDALVLSLFPGIGLLDRAFEREGFSVVRGPDLLWGGDVHQFHAPMDRFEGIIGSPPCQVHSRLNLFQSTDAVDLTDQYLRIVDEAWPDWFVMENVPGGPRLEHPSYAISYWVLDNRWFGGQQRRKRLFTVGVWRGERPGVQPLNLHKWLDVALFENQLESAAVTSAHLGGGHNFEKRGRHVAMPRYTWQEACRLQGLDVAVLERLPFTAEGKLKAVANGVPLPMGQAVARAIRQALYQAIDSVQEEDAG